MKKIISILLTAVLLCTLLSVFAIPASAEETSMTAEEYMSLGMQLESNGEYGDAADAYAAAARQYEAYALSSAVEAYMKAVDCYMKANDWSNAGEYFGSAARLYYRELNDPISAADLYRKAGNCCVKAKDLDMAAIMFKDAGSCLKDSDPAEAAVSYLLASKAAQLNGDAHNADEYYNSAMNSIDAIFAETSDNPTGSTLSEGSLTIIVGIACLVVGFLVAMFIFKKKKPAVAGGENKDEE